jgi:hypothetical protein
MNSKGRKEKIRKINKLKCRGGYFITWGENIIVFGIMKRHSNRSYLSFTNKTKLYSVVHSREMDEVSSF